MITNLVAANLRQRPVRTLLSVLLIAIPVTLMLTLVGLSHGFVDDSSQRTRGVGADIVVRSSDAVPGNMALSNMSEKLITRLAQLPHVAAATGVASHLVSGWTTVAGIDPAGFEHISGPFTYREGHGFQGPDDILLDTYYAQQARVRAGDKVNLLNHTWNVAGLVEPGKLAHIFLPITVVQDMDGTRGKVAQIYLKLDHPSNTNAVIADLQQLLPGYKIYGVEELVSLTSVDNVPFLRPLLNVIIGVAVLIGAAVASLSMYMAVQQRTREIGILKSLGASKLLLLRIILMEALFLGLGGSLLGIGFSFLSRWLLATLVPASLPQAIVPGWWPIAGAIAMGAAILGALYPGLLAARQDPIQALAYE
ncbi:MAG TPA: FtsX-like permease family protein [Candidatus Angelobacter sp.]|nr:FtsX-like permease family protein [Candidatus Angelobacter sp.]